MNTLQPTGRTSLCERKWFFGGHENIVPHLFIGFFLDPALVYIDHMDTKTKQAHKANRIKLLDGGE